MGQPSDLAVTIHPRDRMRSLALYRRLGFRAVGAPDEQVCRLEHAGVELVLADRSVDDEPGSGEDSARVRRSGGARVTVRVRDLDEVLAYWQEEGMLVVTPVHQGRTGRVFHGLDYDGYEVRIEERREQTR